MKLKMKCRLSQINGLIQKYDNPDWKATCEEMNERTMAREKWFIKWFGE
jgi:hypothetical protein